MVHVIPCTVKPVFNSGHLSIAVTCFMQPLKNLPRENDYCVKDPVNSGHLSITATFSVSLEWPLLAGLTVHSL